VAPEPALRLEAGERDELRMLAGPAAGLGLAQAAAADGSLHVHMVQWYPGHIARAERQLKDQLKMVDVVLEVRDARIPVSTWHPQVATWVGAKPSLLVMNRVDMIGRRDREAWAAHYKAAGVPVFWTDGREGAGVQRLRDAILTASVAINAKRARRGLQPRPVRACVIGFPNIGKSALINRLLSAAATRVVESAGMTPGASSRSRPSPSRTHFSIRVTPGLGAVSTTLRLSRRLISALLPMLGKPMTQARTGRGCRLRRARLALIATLADRMASRSRCTPAPSRPSVQKTGTPAAL